MHQVLLVDDCVDIRNLVSQALSSIADLSWASTYEQAKESLANKTYSLVLLDVELPDGNGIDLCTHLQSTQPGLPIFFLSSHVGLSEKVLGFSAGADDYITKPFSLLELKARVEAKLRKLEFTRHSSDLLKWKDIEIHKTKQDVNILSNGKQQKVDLTALEFKLLMYFADKPGVVIPRDQILNDLWGQNVHVYPRSVDTHVSKLRKKLGPLSRIIESVHGAGYKFNPAS